MKRLIATLIAGAALITGATGCSTTVPGSPVPAPVPDHPVHPGIFVKGWELDRCVEV